MVEAVNRLIGNLLSGAGEVFLPGVGSLYVEQQGAQRVDKQTILPPSRSVSFSSQERGASLVGEIARAAGVDEAKAEEIYQTWLARTRVEDTLTIEEVGVLKFKNFVVTPDFDKILNPAGRAPVKIRVAKRGFDWVLWLGVVAIVIAGGLFGYQYLWSPNMCGDPKPVVATEIVSSVAPVVEEVADTTLLQEHALASETPAEAEAVPTVPAQPVEPAVPASKPQAETPQPAVAQASGTGSGQAATSDVLSTVSGNTYVVLGVFSSVENALRAVKEAQEKSPQWQCRIYRMGAKFMVSPFEGTAAACTQFIGEDNGAHAGMWPYNAR